MNSKSPIRIVTATSLFDGHDAAINIVRRILQQLGAEIIHLGHNRSVDEIVNCAIEEDAVAISVSSYQGGHMEFYKYMVDSLKEKNAQHIKIFGGGGGVILPDEIEELQAYGVERLYSTEDGRQMGLKAINEDLLNRISYEVCNFDNTMESHIGKIARYITYAENSILSEHPDFKNIKKKSKKSKSYIIGITGTGGAGKSTLTDELILRLRSESPKSKIAVLSIDPSTGKSKGALLGDRIRMNSINTSDVYFRSLAARKMGDSLSSGLAQSIDVLKAHSFDLIIIESAGIGQSDSSIKEFCDLSIYVMTPEFGAPTQLEKIDMLNYADIVVLNKADKKGAEDSLNFVRKQFRHCQNILDSDLESLPIVATISSRFNNDGVNKLFELIKTKISDNNSKFNFQSIDNKVKNSEFLTSINTPYLYEIVKSVRDYNINLEHKVLAAEKLQSIRIVMDEINSNSLEVEVMNRTFQKLNNKYNCIAEVEKYYNTCQELQSDTYKYNVRKKEITVETYNKTLSGTKIPKVAVPRYRAWSEIINWCGKENFPGSFPYTAGVFPFKREQEDPTRMFAGEGSPERTNKRFHYLSKGMPAARLSTAFDSVTLYGEDPDRSPDVYGKIGNSGVSIASLDDVKKLYSGFDLCQNSTSVSMTINGPAPIMTAYFLNCAIDQQCEKYIVENNLTAEIEQKIIKIYSDRKRLTYSGSLPEGNNGFGLMLLGVTGDQVLPSDIYNKIKEQTLTEVRGTVQADILKEDQAQNTCIFSIEFALKMMTDIQLFFTQNGIKNFYSVSVSGYHIAEAGANPITQLAFTLANGFTLVEMYLQAGMKIDEFAPNLSFFFSNGMDAEYSVIGRVARSIWAKVIKTKYGGNENSQKLKYHIQTSGRSLHAQEIDFNDIRTTLQALYGAYDNCNSMHTNAYDEAVTTPTEESVRRALAIQLIINKELGLNLNQNTLQGSFIIEELTQRMEEAVLKEFENLDSRGGVLGAMESMYQRSKIQMESMEYEQMKQSGKLPLVGINTFISSAEKQLKVPKEIIRSTEEEKHRQVENREQIQANHSEKSKTLLNDLKLDIVNGKNVFTSLMEVSKYATIGQITETLYQSGGKYRRNT